MALFSGTYHHKVDLKGKVSVPKTFRKGLTGDMVWLTQGPHDENIWLYDQERWVERMSKLDNLADGEEAYDLKLFMLGSAHEVQIDAVGRIQIPQALRSFAGIDNNAVSFVGMGSRVEIWEKDRLETRRAKIVEQKNVPKYMRDFNI